MKSAHMFTQDQLDYFNAFGFVTIKHLFDEPTMKKVTNAADRLWKNDFEGPPKPDSSLQQDRFVERNETLISLIDNPILFNTLQQILGKRLIFCGSEGNYGIAGSPSAHHWHADRPGAAELTYLRIKVMIYLSPMREANGALRVIPGSHREPLHQALLPFNQRHTEMSPVFFGQDGSKIPAYIIETNPGDAILFSQTIFHSVYFTEHPKRRYIALKYASWPRNYSQFASLQRWQSSVFQPAPQLRNSKSPRLRSMVEPIVAAKQSLDGWPPDLPWERA